MAFVFFLVSALASVHSWTLIFNQPGAATHASADANGNFFVVDERAALVKIDSLGNALYRYQRVGGTPNAVDATDPFKLVLHYPASGTAVFLDNTLTPIGSLNLVEAGYPDAAAVCRSSDDRLWVYDASTHRLQKLETNGALYREGADLLQHTGRAVNVSFMREHDQRVYLCDSALGIVVTDAYGNYERTLPLAGLTEFQFLHDRLLYVNATAVVTYDPRTNAADSVALENVAPFQRAVYANDRLLTLGQNGLSLYRRARP